MAYEASPISTVDGVACPRPSAFAIDFEDVSKSTAGRTEDTEMHKERVGTCVKIMLQYNAVSQSEAHTILSIFHPEYVSVKYRDDLSGAERTSTFYCGTPHTEFINSALGIRRDISVNLIERKAHDRS